MKYDIIVSLLSKKLTPFFKPRPNDRNIVVRNMLPAFSHRIAGCCYMLGVVYFSCTFVDVAWCCTRLVRFVEQCCTCYTSSILNIQHVATLRKRLVWRQPLFILRLCEQNSFVMVRLEILLWLYGPETFPGLSRNGPQGSNPDRSLRSRAH